MISVKTLFFASLASICETAETDLKLPDGATVADALDLISQNHHAFPPLRNTVATAVNMAYVKSDHVLQANDELALIPPVSGG